ncbi:E2 [Human papillomavirus type 195]|uniref:Regulatory protein E2 n=1 Tax=Betapapillomavirus 1 TaxID=337051 RepID=A0A2D2AKX1_9PAPI|nr:E2 [Human papillomavirus type 195]ATQ38101.1 E2 [Betapapillomavirus 1]
MEALNERFSALQDQLMNIYEAAKSTLEAQIDHWQLLRKEAVLLFVARQKGIMRLGYQPVPPQAVSESKAKNAIMMVLQLESLNKSKYKDEPWTLVETSLETYKNTPENTFKKGPMNVEVMYDKDPGNTNLYTMWKYVYYLDADDNWQKAESGANHTGIYYMHGNFRHYYVLFADDAPRFSATGHWEVIINKDTVFAPVTSSTPPESPGQGQERQLSDKSTGPTTTDTASQRSPRASPTTTGDTECPKKRRRYGRKDSSPTATPKKRSTRQTWQRQRPRSRSLRTQTRRHTRSRSTSSKPTRRHSSSSSSSSSSCSRRSVRRRRRTRSRSASRAKSPATRAKSRTRSRTKSPGRRAGGRSSRRSSSSSSSPNRRSRSRRERELSYDRGISPSLVGKSVQTVSGRHKGRLGRLLAEAHDPPVILVKGDPNTLKCFRNRSKTKYKDLIKAVSTTWSWVSTDGCERIGRARMLFSFSSYEHRRMFDNKVKYPKNVERTFGQFDSL